MKLRYTKRARLDLTEIHDHIARHNPQAARRVVTMIKDNNGYGSCHIRMGSNARKAETP